MRVWSKQSLSLERKAARGRPLAWLLMEQNVSLPIPLFSALCRYFWSLSLSPFVYGMVLWVMISMTSFNWETPAASAGSATFGSSSSVTIFSITPHYQLFVGNIFLSIWECWNKQCPKREQVGEACKYRTYGSSKVYLAIYLIVLIRWPWIKQRAISHLSVEYPTMILLCLESVGTTA